MSKIVVEERGTVEDEYVVEGTISARVDGGLLVTMQDGTTAFLPASQLDLRPVRDPGSFIGERHRFRIIKFKKDGSRILSRRVLLERDRAELKAHNAETERIELGLVARFGLYLDR